jgi:stress-induced morphogen
MESTNNLNKNNNYVYDESQTTTSDSNNNTPHCRVCGTKFDDMAKMQRHVMIEHMDKGDILED